MDWHYSVFWIVLILKFTLGEHCNETLNTVRNVSSCPLNKEEWQAAAKRMDCSKIKMTKNCENVTYHCLRHAVTKKMVEVCTVPRNLKGFCPHFYEDQPYVRDDYKRDCSSSSMCLPFYSSKDAYNYSACYNTSIPTTISSSDVLKPTSVTTVQNIHVSADGISKETGKSNNTWIWILLVVIFLLIVVVYIIAVAWVTKSKRKSVREALCLHQHIFEGKALSLTFSSPELKVRASFSDHLFIYLSVQLSIHQ
ncbi:uncharacterized protein LOC134268579 [Saccostrea cucullata]|uniref:uncharacterized protein LOC134268579 n=1 Tax=Saccostrea cuccullata TaxID=36930 RepID=UPI002ED41E6E